MPIPLIALTHDVESELTETEFEREVWRHLDNTTGASLKGLPKELFKKASEGIKRSKGGAQVLASKLSKKVNRAVAGAKRPNLWPNVTVKELADRLIKSYKMYFEELGWEQIQEDFDTERVIYAETGLMVHAKIVISKHKTRVTLYDSIPESTKTQLPEATINYKDETFAGLTAAVDTLLKALSFSFMNKD